MRTLQDVELIDVRLCELLRHGQRRDLPAAHLIGQEVREDIQRLVYNPLLLEFRRVSQAHQVSNNFLNKYLQAIRHMSLSAELGKHLNRFLVSRRRF